MVAPTTASLDSTLLSALLEGSPEYIYFKDRDSRFIAVSMSLVRAFGKTTPEEVLGKTDFDFYAEAHARVAFEDEQEIIRTGRPLVDRLEKEYWPGGSITWGMSTKMPLRNAQGEIIGTFGLTKNVTEQKRIEAELEKTHRELLASSRVAGMAEVATGVLHNVGNVLTSLNVSASLIGTTLRHSKVETLARVAALLREHQHDLAHYVTEDPKGRRVPEFLGTLAQNSIEERDTLLQELSSLQRNIDHIKEIVAMQQAYATMIGVVEALDPVALVEDSVRMNAGALLRHDVHVVRDFTAVPKVRGEQAKVLQILVNLIRNAKYACDDSGSADKRITLRVQPGAAGRVQIIVQDNGIGIPAENLPRLFQHGFTTRPKGHGFGLHSASNAAREMKGTLTAYSAGVGKGATFTLDLPVADDAPGNGNPDSPAA